MYYFYTETCHFQDQNISNFTAVSAEEHLVYVDPTILNIIYYFTYFRQPTPFDKLCYQSIDPDQGPLGSRVFGNCDVYIREIMANLLDEEDLKEWETQAEDRMEQYSTQRCSYDEISLLSSQQVPVSHETSTTPTATTPNPVTPATTKTIVTTKESITKTKTKSTTP